MEKEVQTQRHRFHFDRKEQFFFGTPRCLQSLYSTSNKGPHFFRLCAPWQRLKNQITIYFWNNKFIFAEIFHFRERREI
jgi:hypothetical protein